MLTEWKNGLLKQLDGVITLGSRVVHTVLLQAVISKGG